MDLAVLVWNQTSDISSPQTITFPHNPPYPPPSNWQCWQDTSCQTNLSLMSVLISDCITDILTPLDIPKPFGRQCEEFLIWFANCQIGKLADRVQPRQQSCQTLTSHPDLFQTSRWLQFKTGTVISHLDDDQISNLQLNYPLKLLQMMICGFQHFPSS